ncbi:MAG: hypothetical protein JXB07_16750 [Anaerolineae bacterium]|nr:hypothetical protein [Anaerolineae bacterium]
MSILNNLELARKAYQQQPLLMSEASLVTEYDAAKRAYASALAHNDMGGSLFWLARANTIAQQIARLEDQNEIVTALGA